MACNSNIQKVYDYSRKTDEELKQLIDDYSTIVFQHRSLGMNVPDVINKSYNAAITERNRRHYNNLVHLESSKDLQIPDPPNVTHWNSYNPYITENNNDEYDQLKSKVIEEPKTISKSKDYSDISIENLENIKIEVKEVKPKVNLDF